MKKLLLLTFFIMSASLAKAQDIYYGPSAGLNLSTITKQTYSNDYLRGNLGVHVGYNLTNEISLQGELLYSWQGTKFNDSDSKISLNYFKLPVIGRLNIFNGMSIEAGLSFNFLTYANSVTGNTRVNTMDLMKKFDIAIPLGVNYLFGDRYELGLRYDLSMIRVYKNNDNRARNSNLSLNLRYRL